MMQFQFHCDFVSQMFEIEKEHAEILTISFWQSNKTSDSTHGLFLSAIPSITTHSSMITSRYRSTGGTLDPYAT